MSEAALFLIEDALNVSAGRRTPLGTARDYTIAALEFAATRAEPGEDAHAALLRLTSTATASSKCSTPAPSARTPEPTP